MKGEPSRRLRRWLDWVCESWMGVGLLVQEDFAVLFACDDHVSEASDAAAVRFWALEEAAVASDCIADSILCRAVEL